MQPQIVLEDRETGPPYPITGQDGFTLLRSRAPEPNMLGINMGGNIPEREWLQNVCAKNGFVINDNSGGRDCAYISVLTAMVSVGTESAMSVSQLRHIVPDELEMNRELYSVYFEAPQPHKIAQQPNRARNFQ